MLLEHRGERPKVHDSAYVAPNATLCGDVTVGENVRVMFGAVLTAEVRVNGTVHLKTALPSETVVPIGWVAVGDPAEVLPPGEHERIWELQEPLDFPGTIFGVERGPAGEMMPEMLRRYTGALGAHREDTEPQER